MIIRLIAGLVMLLVTVAAGVAALAGLAAGTATLVGLAVASADSAPGVKARRRHAVRGSVASGSAFEPARPTDALRLDEPHYPWVVSATASKEGLGAAVAGASRGDGFQERWALRAVLFDEHALESLEAGEPVLAGYLAGGRDSG